MNDIIKLDNGYWISKTEYDNVRKFHRQLEKKGHYTKWGTSENYLEKRKIRDEIALPQSRWKLAIVLVGNTNKTVFVDSLTANAYKCGDYYEKTWMKIPKYTFIRWARGMDI